MAARKKQKAPTFTTGRLVLLAVSIATGAFGVFGWLNAEGDTIQNAVLAFLAGASAFVVPVAVGTIGRSTASWLLLAPALVFGAVNAYSVHNAVGVLIEQPRADAFAKTLEPVKAKAATAEAVLAEAKQAERNVTRTGPCEGRDTCGRQEARYEADLAQAAKIVAAASADVDTAKAELQSADTYTPFVDDKLVWAIGALIDVALALGFFAFEATSRREQANLDARLEAKREAANRAKHKAGESKRRPVKKKAGGVVTNEEAAFILNARGPRLVVDNARLH